MSLFVNKSKELYNQSKWDVIEFRSCVHMNKSLSVKKQTFNPGEELYENSVFMHGGTEKK